jgi:hypothetical protein
VPLAGPLRVELAEHKLRQTPPAEEIVFPNRLGRPFSSDWVAERAAVAWKRAQLRPIGLHDCRHTYAAFMIAAGVNAKALSAYMGHSSITITSTAMATFCPAPSSRQPGCSTPTCNRPQRPARRRALYEGGARGQVAVTVLDLTARGRAEVVEHRSSLYRLLEGGPGGMGTSLR